MSVFRNSGYEEAMTMISNSDSGTATTSKNRPCHMSKLWTALSFRQEEHAENMLRRMQEYMESRKFCDVILVAGIDGRRVSAHRLILAATSEYFANLFAQKQQTPKEAKESDSETEEEEELSTTELSDEMPGVEEVTIVGLLRRKSNEEEEQYVTMRGHLRLKSKQEDSSEFYFAGILSRGSRLDDEEVEDVKCTKNFYNQECKKLEEQELPHCLELRPGEYFRTYPEIVSQEINSRIVKSIDDLCLEAKLERDEVAQPLNMDPTQTEIVTPKAAVSEDSLKSAATNPMQVELLLAKEELSEASSQGSSEKSQLSQHNANNITVTPPNEYLDPLLLKLAPGNSEDSLLNKTLRSSLKNIEGVEKQPQAKDALDECCVLVNCEETSSSSELNDKDNGFKKVIRIAESTDKSEVNKKLCYKFVQLKDRMKGGGVSEPEINIKPATATSSILPQNAENKKSQEQKKDIQNQKQLRAISRTAEFDIKDNGKPLRLSLRYESKNKEISLTGTLSSNKEDGRNDFKLTRLGKEILQQRVEKSKEATVKESSKEDDDFKLTRSGEYTSKQKHVESQELVIEEKDELSISNWFRSDSSEKDIQQKNKVATEKERQSLDMLPSSSLQKKKAPVGALENANDTTKQNFKDMLEVWKCEDWKKEKVSIPTTISKKTRKDRLGTLRRKFERKEKATTNEITKTTMTAQQDGKQGVTKVILQSREGSCEKLAAKQETKLFKIKERLYTNLFSTQSSKREDSNTHHVDGASKQSISASKNLTGTKSSSATTTVRQQSSLEIKRVSIEYIAEEARKNKVGPRRWLKRAKRDTDDINCSKVLSSITEEDEHVSDEHSKGEKNEIDKAELKLLKSWRCLDPDKEKSTDLPNYSACSILPEDLDVLDISRKPIHNIAKKTQDNRTLAELFHDLIKAETQEESSHNKDAITNSSTILDSILRENLEAHAAALCGDINIQQKVNQILRKEGKAALVAPAELKKESEIVVPQLQVNVEEIKKQQSENLTTEQSTDDNDKATAVCVSPQVQLYPNMDTQSKIEPVEAVPLVEQTDVRQDNEIFVPQLQANVEEIKKQQTQNLTPEHSTDDDDKVTAALISRQVESLTIKVSQVKVPPEIAKRNVQFQDVIEENDTSRRPQKLLTQENNCKFEPKKYWHTPKVVTPKAKKPNKSAPLEVLLDSVNGSTLQLLVDYCYTGNIEFQEEHTAKNVLATAGMLQLKDIVRECTNFLARKLHPSNCLGVVNFAQEQNYKRLFDEAKDYASRHFVEVCKYNEFYELSADQLAQILSSDELNLPCEEEVFNCIMAWIQYDRENRHMYLPILLQQLRLPLMQPSFILKYVEPVCANTTPACHRLVIQALKWHLLPSVERQSLYALPCELVMKPRKSRVPWNYNPGKLLAVGYNISEKTITLESFSASLNKWSITKRKRLLPGRKGYAVAVVENQLLLIGGYEDWDGAKALNTVLCLDLQSLNWTLLQPMTECRYGSTVAVLNGFVYVMGGGDYYRTGFLNSVERWDSETYTWSQVASMATKRIYAGAVVLDNLLYVVGGSNDSEYLNTMECYDPYRDLWTFKASMCERRSECGVGAAHGYIYVVGGFFNGSRSSTVERYNPISDSWTRVCSLETARSCCGCAVLGNRLVTLGGYDEIGVSLRSVEEYNINMNQWEPFPSMTSRYFSLFVVTVLDKTPKTAHYFKYGDEAAHTNEYSKIRHCKVKD